MSHKRTIPFLILASLPLAAAGATDGSWVVVEELAPELAEDAKLATDLAKLTRSKVSATGAAVVAADAVEEARTAVGIAKVNTETLPTLVDGAEASHGLLVSVRLVDTKLELSVRRYDAGSEVIAMVSKTTTKAALKRNLRRVIAEILKSPKAAKKQPAAAEGEIDPQYHKIGITVANLDKTTAEDLGLKKTTGAHVIKALDGRVGARALRAGDVILKVDKKRVKNSSDVAGLFLQASLGARLSLELWRDGAKMTAELVLAPPSEPEASSEEAAAGDDADTGGGQEEAEKMTPPRRLGVRVRTISPEVAETLGLKAPTGALVKVVKPGSVGEKAQLQPDDVILAVDDTPVAHASFLTEIVKKTHPKKKIRIDVWRDKESLTLQGVFEPPVE